MKTGVRVMRWIGVALALGAMVSCGGGGGGSAPPPAGVFAQMCSPNNPYRGDATAATTVGSLSTEKTWLRDYMDRVYLWYNEVPNVNAAAAAYSNESDVYTSLDNYFRALKTPNLTASGARKDKFSFTYPTAAWNQLINSGSSAGWGVEWHFDTVDPNTATMNGIRVAFVHDGSPAASVDLRRGDRLVSIDGLTASATNNASAYNALLDRLYPANGLTIDFIVDRNGTQLSKRLTSTNVTLTSTKYQTLTVGSAKVGYLLFNDHLATAEAGLTAAVNQMVTDRVSDLVLDLRYNGGGYLYIASQLAYMLAGATATSGRVFERIVFNDKRSSENSATAFEDRSCNGVVSNGQLVCTTNTALPTLNLSRVYVLTTGSTCSASEAVINGLRGVGLDVRLIGRTTCGKPYGFFAQDNCGITYFPIEFQGVNAAGFGDYSDGFIPGGTGASASNVPGCTANDDLSHALGDPTEGQLAAALAYRASGNAACLPVAIGREAPMAANGTAGTLPGRVLKEAARTNRNASMPMR